MIKNELSLQKKLKFTAMKKVAILLSLAVLFAVSCAKSDLETTQQVSSVSSTPCKQDVLKSSGLSDKSNKVDVEFTNKGVQITHYDFEVSCDFTTVNVTHSFVNGVLNITQQGTPNQANCICYTDVSYTINGISQDEVNVIFINGVQVYCYNNTLQELCHCIMDTLKGEWSWVKQHGGLGGNTIDNEFKSIVKILNQNEDASINYEVFVEDTLFYRGNFQIQEEQWNRRTANIKLPHDIWRDNITWHIYFFNILEMEYNEEKGVFEHKPSNDTLTFWDGAMDGYNYIYKKIK